MVIGNISRYATLLDSELRIAKNRLLVNILRFDLVFAFAYGLVAKKDCE